MGARSPGNIAGMGYKILGFVVWQAMKLVVRRKLAANRGKVAVGAVSAVVAGGLAVARRQQTRA